jgi:hypothetical protein
MAESFSDTFPIDKLGDPAYANNYDNSQVPPSPTITSLTSESYRDDDSQTTVSDLPEPDDSMDWTPTRPMLQARGPVQVQQIPFGQPQFLPLSPPLSFTGAPIQPQAPKPFQGALPPAPKAPAHKICNPFPQPLVPKVSETQKQDFLSSMMFSSSQGSEKTKNSLHAKRESKEFVIEEGKLKWVEEPAVTGLEGMFETVFSVKDPEGSPQKGKGRTASGVISVEDPQKETGLQRRIVNLLLAIAVPVALSAGLVMWNGWY